MCALARGCALEELGLAGGLPGVSDFVVRVLAEERHGSLALLDLSRSRITDAAVHALAGAHGGHCCGALHTLRLTACERLTDAGLAAATRGLPALATLAVDGCGGVSAAAVAEVRAARPALDVRR